MVHYDSLVSFKHVFYWKDNFIQVVFFLVCVPQRTFLEPERALWLPSGAPTYGASPKKEEQMYTSNLAEIRNERVNKGTPFLLVSCNTQTTADVNYCSSIIRISLTIRLRKSPPLYRVVSPYLRWGESPSGGLW